MNVSADALPAVSVSKGFEATEQEKAQWVRRYIESGLSLREFSARHGMGRMSLWRWVNKASDKTVMAVDCPAPAFTEIKFSPSVERPDWVAEVSLPGERVLRLSKQVPAWMLEQLLRVC